MYVAVFALGLKGLLNWVFIFGHWGAPALGGAGCGVAMAITMWFEAAAMLWLLGRLPAVRGTNLFTRPRGPAWGTLSQLLRLGTPIGLASFFEMAAFSLVTLLVARFGATAVAAQQIAFSVNGIIFMLPMGLGIAATIRIGHALGEGRPEAARRAAEVAIAAAVGVGIAAALILLGAREGIARLYTREGDVALLSATLLLFVAVYIIVDSAQATAMGALRGYKDTRGPMLIAFGGYWLFALPLGTALGLGWVPGVGALGVYGFWIGLSLGLALVAGGLLWRLLRRSHRATLPA
jgi:MATE family multidrug resistance protein